MACGTVFLMLFSFMSIVTAVKNAGIVIPDLCMVYGYQPGYSVDCSETNLTENPAIQLNTLQKFSFINLDLTKNEISRISANLYTEKFLKVSQSNKTTTALCITWLLLSDNKISEIEDGAFDNEPNCLDYLNLSNNSLTTDSIKEIRKLKALTYLDLSFNYFPNIESCNFIGFPKLNTLNLANSKINTIEPRSFSELKHIKTLILRGNFLTTFQPNTFAGLSNLNHLDISYNPIKQYQESYFEDLMEDCVIERYSHINLTGQIYKNGVPIEALTIGDNILTNDKAGSMCEGKVKLSGKLEDWKLVDFLNNCNFTDGCYQEIICYGMTEFPQLIVHVSEEIESNQEYDLEFRNSSISEIPSGLYVHRLLMQYSNTLQPLQVGKLSLKDNQINIIHERAFIGETGALELLDLRFNNITSIPTKALSFLRNISHINLHGNEFATINAHSFKLMPSLRQLILSRCEIKNIVANALDGLTSLELLSLRGNNVSKEFPSFYGLPVSTKIYY